MKKTGIEENPVDLTLSFGFKPVAENIVVLYLRGELTEEEYIEALKKEETRVISDFKKYLQNRS